MKSTKTILCSLAATLIAACATATPPELLNARTAYDRASIGPASQLAPADLHAAKEALAGAERSFADHGDTDETRDLAYAAERKAELADVHARTVSAVQTRSSAIAQVDALRDQQVRITSAELGVATQQLQSERQRTHDAERRAEMAAAELQRIASVKQDARGMVITLPSEVLFETAKSDLRAAAQAKLSEVSDVLTRDDPDSRITVQGYTDSQGTLSFNQDLSQRRAESVRGYLVSHGIAADRVTAQGFGPSNPVASNASPEGRADNRRVEIVVQPSHTVSSGTP